MDLVLRRDGVDRLDALQGFKTNPGFQIRDCADVFSGTLGSFLSVWDLTIRPVQLSGSHLTGNNLICFSLQLRVNTPSESLAKIRIIADFQPVGSKTIESGTMP